MSYIPTPAKIADAAVKFAVSIVSNKRAGHAGETDAVRNAGYSNAEIIEIIADAALNTFTNYTNNALYTEIYFPKATALRET